MRYFTNSRPIQNAPILITILVFIFGSPANLLPVKVQRRFLIAFFICCALLIGQEGERVAFTSANPFSLYHIITDLDNQEFQESYGILRIPDNAEPKKLPLVVGVAGSKNWADHHLEYLAMYREMGFATFELQSFDARSVQSTVGEQISVTTAMMILDAYRALDVLVEDPRINAERIAITGWSLGGGVTLFSAWTPVIEAIQSKGRFRAHLSFYPPCISNPGLIDFSDSPIHILAGELDNWVPAEPCEDLALEMQAAGVNAGITVYPNAHHGFDRKGELEIAENGYTTGNCNFTMRKDGALLMNFLDIPMITPLRQKIALAFCAGRGPTLGGNPEARKAAFAFAREFMQKHLGQ
ncbi:MAG: dienelactone hydrolase family protein [Candidatus Marinimicrobia bacterium]|jgi:dienelactone hydrolase|nr:dienelactone hydrolase family protein [Candidatus Neomarinimicrobiota bacterium]MDP6611242.1 dienelactone hydrolase family protein [Candidatus Neomarinimicrobiota bacterium]|tara:strand:- start:647 stop:1708 length:1062 start_codon:yes stop_codon:yes gene_type:complete